MARATGLHEELDILRAELGRTDAKGRSPRAEPASPKDEDQAAPAADAAADLEEQFGELGKILSEHTGGVEDFVKEHPLVSVLAAFALGVAVGRLMGRS